MKNCRNCKYICDESTYFFCGIDGHYVTNPDSYIDCSAYSYKKDVK